MKQERVSVLQLFFKRFWNSDTSAEFISTKKSSLKKMRDKKLISGLCFH